MLYACPSHGYVSCTAAVCSVLLELWITLAGVPATQVLVVATATSTRAAGAAQARGFWLLSMDLQHASVTVYSRARVESLFILRDCQVICHAKTFRSTKWVYREADRFQMTGSISPWERSFGVRLLVGRLRPRQKCTQPLRSTAPIGLLRNSPASTKICCWTEVRGDVLTWRWPTSVGDQQAFQNHNRISDGRPAWGECGQCVERELEQLA